LNKNIIDTTSLSMEMMIKNIWQTVGSDMTTLYSKNDSDRYAGIVSNPNIQHAWVTAYLHNIVGLSDEQIETLDSIDVFKTIKRVANMDKSFFESAPFQ
jgi:hypothetical protein